MATLKELLTTKISYDNIVDAERFDAEIEALEADMEAVIVVKGETTTAGMTFVLDEDTMTTNSATKLATQQSIKAYVDAKTQVYSERATDGAIATSGTVVLTKTSTGAYTLALPAAGDDGNRLTITAGTAHAHVVTLADEQLYDGTSTPKDTITFTAQIGASINLVAVNETYHLVGTCGTVTLTDAA